MHLLVALGLLTGRTFSAAGSTSRPKHIVITHRAENGITQTWRIPCKLPEPVTGKKYGTLLSQATARGLPLALGMIMKPDTWQFVDLCALLQSHATTYCMTDFPDDSAAVQLLKSHILNLDPATIAFAVEFIKPNGKAMSKISYTLAENKIITDLTLLLRFTLTHDHEALKALALVRSVLAFTQKLKDRDDARIWLSFYAHHMPDDTDIPGIMDLVNSPDASFEDALAKIGPKIPASLMPSGLIPLVATVEADENAKPS
jgi:hypothetical protein